MEDSRKGRALIISLPTFVHEGLHPLEGYREYTHLLGQLWEQMGFEVYTPTVRADRSLTAEVSTFMLLKPCSGSALSDPGLGLHSDR